MASSSSLGMFAGLSYNSSSDPYAVPPERRCATGNTPPRLEAGELQLLNALVPRTPDGPAPADGPTPGAAPPPPHHHNRRHSFARATPLPPPPPPAFTFGQASRGILDLARTDPAYRRHLLSQVLNELGDALRTTARLFLWHILASRDPRAAVLTQQFTVVLEVLVGAVSMWKGSLRQDNAALQARAASLAFNAQEQHLRVLNRTTHYDALDALLTGGAVLGAVALTACPTALWAALLVTAVMVAGHTRGVEYGAWAAVRFTTNSQTARNLSNDLRSTVSAFEFTIRGCIWAVGSFILFAIGEPVLRGRQRATQSALLALAITGGLLAVIAKRSFTHWSRTEYQRTIGRKLDRIHTNNAPV